MKKTVFVGRVNDQEFDNVQDYNACVQAMIDMGKNFQATSSTQVVEVPEDDCECTCSGKDECSKCNHTEKPLKPVATMLPAFETRENGKYIDAITDLDTDEKYNEAMDNLDVNLNAVYDRVAECIPHNTPEQLTVYGEAVRSMINTLDSDFAMTMKAIEPVNDRIAVLEAELDDLYAKSTKLERASEVIATYKEFYNAIEGLLIQRNFDTNAGTETPNATEESYEVTDDQVREAAQRLTTGFVSLLREIFSK